MEVVFQFQADLIRLVDFIGNGAVTCFEFIDGVGVLDVFIGRELILFLFWVELDIPPMFNHLQYEFFQLVDRESPLELLHIL